MDDALKPTIPMLEGTHASRIYICPTAGCGKVMTLMADSGIPDEAWPKAGELLCPECNEARAEWGGKEADYMKRMPETFGAH